jgi:predicted nucleotidyltransferase
MRVHCCANWKNEMSIDMGAALLRQVQDILEEFAPTCEIWAFGSRVRKGAKPFADLDLAIISPDGTQVRQLALLASAFEESDLPFKVDLLDWAFHKSRIPKANYRRSSTRFPAAKPSTMIR